MIDEREVFEKSFRRYEPEGGSFERLVRRRDRKRRNQRIAAGVVGIAVFVAAVWIVTSGLSLDRSEKSVAPAGEVTGPAETEPAPPLASGAPDLVEQGTCSGQSGLSWLELTDTGDKIRARFVVRYAQGGQKPWRFVLRHGRAGPDPFNYGDGRVFFEGITVRPFLSQEVAVQASVGDLEGDDGFAAKAVNQGTGQVCKALGVI